MSAPRRPPPDQADRLLIRTALDDNLLVEAGAGSGKTTALVDRMLRLIAGGHATVGEIAAVTFTRKAAGELRQRFQERLESALAAGRLDPDAPPFGADITARLQEALRGIDRAFMGTIHAFCARLLRERPLDARLDPGFRELTAPEERILARRFWDDFLERLTAADDPRLAALDAVGLRPYQLHDPFRRLSEAADVEFPLGDVSPPSDELLARVRRRIESILDDARPGLPEERPDRECWIQKKVRTLLYLRAVLDWDRPADLMIAVRDLCSSQRARRTLKHWTFSPDQVKDLEARINELIEVTDDRPHPPARALLDRWQAHCYGPAMALIQDAARGFAEHRRSTGQLTFHDLLLLATDLLRRSPGARRGLGLRWRRLLVDEFQDTDPLQAELLFLLASEPSEEAESGAPLPWTRLEPRPGALFVVGDPKQSIYRFRRADIALYGRVRARFAEFGRVVRLEANFRSTAPIKHLVAGVFDPALGGLFPAEGTDRQAGYAPLLTQPWAIPAPAEGVFRYEIPEAAARSGAKLAAWESESLAEWIAERVASGERTPDDFLILTRTRRHLAAYARALEARNLPVLVSGSGVGIESELSELRILLRSLVDPGDPLLVLATLEGLFFGLDPRQLLLHGEAGGTLDYRATRQPPGPVADALATLRGWWETARDRPADEVVDAIVASVGLLPWAASGELGGLRAGALSFTLDLIRSATVADDASLASALDALALVLDDDDTEVEAPLEPGRGGAVRVMNLHKSKGLEAPVVILACPTGDVPTGRSLVIDRDDDGASIGWCAVEEVKGTWPKQSVTTLAAADGWIERREREIEFEVAEHDRLLYVAVTRAAEELVVGTKPPGTKRRGPWEPLEPWLEREAERLTLPTRPAPDRVALQLAPSTLQAREVEATERRETAGVSGARFDTVTGIVKADEPVPTPDLFAGLDDGPGDPTASGEGADALGWTESLADGTGPGGLGWGNAVHATLEAALAGRDAAVLTQVARTALLENDRPVEDGEPVELEPLLVLVERIRGSALWERALAAELRLTEQPFAIEHDDGHWIEGVIDLAFREPEGWVIVDYKTAADDRAYALRLPHYRRQVELYAEAWRRLTGEPVVDTLIWRVG